MSQDEKISLSFLRGPVVWAVTIARILIALYIFINPLWGVLISMVADWVDNLILVYMFRIVRRPEYQLWDKNVDWFAYVVELIVATSFGLYLPFFLLLFWRFLGQFMFMHTHKRWIFIFFPNFFEMAILWLVIFYPHGGLSSWPTGHTLVWLIVFLVFKQLHEMYLHIVLSQHPEWGERFFRWLFRR